MPWLHTYTHVWWGILRVIKRVISLEFQQKTCNISEQTKLLLITNRKLRAYTHFRSVKIRAEIDTYTVSKCTRFKITKIGIKIDRASDTLSRFFARYKIVTYLLTYP